MGRPYKIKRHKRIYRRSAGSIVLRVVVIVAAIAVLFGWDGPYMRRSANGLRSGKIRRRSRT